MADTTTKKAAAKKSATARGTTRKPAETPEPHNARVAEGNREQDAPQDATNNEEIRANAAKDADAPPAENHPVVSVGDADEQQKANRENSATYGQKSGALPEGTKSHFQRNRAAETDQNAEKRELARSAAEGTVREASYRDEVQEKVVTLANGKTEAVVKSPLQYLAQPPEAGDATPSGSAGLDSDTPHHTHPTAESGVSAVPGGEQVKCYGCQDHYDVNDGDAQRAHGTHLAARDMTQQTLVKWVTELQQERDRLLTGGGEKQPNDRRPESERQSA